ncbi:triokinase/FMN cyclase-like isoform X2, partial [Leptotrombidium deliense]
TELESFSKCIHTINVALTACNIPGVGMSFKLPKDQIEVGLGLHGEAGIRRTNMLTTPVHFGTAIFINNLGGLTVMEINILCKETLTYVQQKGFVVERIVSEMFATSFNMAGVSITVLEVDALLIKLLDARAVCEVWQAKCNIKRAPNKNPFLLTSKSVKDEENENEKLDSKLELPFGKDFFIVATREVRKRLLKNEAYLNELDRVGGDSDCGSTLAKGCNAVIKALDANSLRPSFTQLARISESAMGGTSGAVYSQLFSAAAREVTSISKTASRVDFWLKCVTRAINKISEYGQAKVGDRTMLDALNAVRLVFEQNKYLTDFSFIARQLTRDVEAATKAKATMELKAGRAAYVDAILVTEPDPGAAAVSIWVKALVMKYNEFYK